MRTQIFNCPINWCEGGILEHGGDGAPPDEWTHYSAADEIVPGLFGAIESRAGEGAHYVVSTDEPYEPVSCGPEALRELALRFEAAAIQLRDRAQYLEGIR